MAGYVRYRDDRGFIVKRKSRTGPILWALVKVLAALAVSAIALGCFEEGLLPHLVACFSGCYFVHFLSHLWGLLKGKDHHHDGC